MPKPEKSLPLTVDEWKAGTPEEFREWILHIANEYLWRVDDSAYNFLATLGTILEKQGWQYERPETAEVGDIVVDEVVIDVRKFAVQKASEILEFDIIDCDEEAKELVKAAKKIEKYILGS